jgi:hypothetical protein
MESVSVADQRVFGPPGSGSGSISQGYGSGSDLLSSSKNGMKNLDFYYFVTSFDFLPLKKDVKVPSKSIMQKNFFLISFLLAS